MTGQGKSKGTALSRCRVDPDSASVMLDNPPAEGQADAGARNFVLRVQARESVEDPLMIFGRDADAVIPDANLPFLGMFFEG